MTSFLHGDCLVSVLSYLPLAERLRVEKVSKQWYNLMPYMDVKKFCLDDLKWPPRHVSEFSYDRNGLTYTQDVFSSKWFQIYLTGLLARIGHHLEAIELYCRQPTKHINAFRLFITPELVKLLVQHSTNLKKIYMSQSLIEFAALPVFGELQKLTVLSIPSCVFFDQNRAPFQNSVELKQAVDLLIDNHPSLSQLNIAQLSFIPQFANANLRRLHLMSLPLNNEDLVKICSNCPQLESLGLTGCRFITSFTVLAMLPSLTQLWLNGTQISTDDLRLICASCTKLEKLRLDGCGQLTSFACLRSLPHLTLLWIGPNNAFTDADLARVARAGKLDNLYVSSSRITNEGLRFISRHCTKLQELNISHTAVTDQGLCNLILNCCLLKLLNAQSTDITNRTLEVIGESSKELKDIYVQSCRELDEEGFFTFYKQRLKRLRTGEILPIINITTGGHRSNPISQNAIDTLAQLGVNLIVQRPLLALHGL